MRQDLLHMQAQALLWFFIYQSYERLNEVPRLPSRIDSLAALKKSTTSFALRGSTAQQLRVGGE
jgi:hypothetical protein